MSENWGAITCVYSQWHPTLRLSKGRNQENQVVAQFKSAYGIMPFVYYTSTGAKLAVSTYRLSH
jgi:hypothetical protein